MAALAGASPALAGARIPTAGLSTAPRASFLVLPPLPRHSFSSYSSSSNSSDVSRFASVRVRASSSSEEASSSTEELLLDLKEKWDAIENKPAVFLYGGGALVAVWLSSIVVGAINSVPLLPKIMELVGLGYTGWFVYRYLLFKSSRKELANDIEDLKKKIAGTGSPSEEAIAESKVVPDLPSQVQFVGSDTSTDKQSPEVELVNSGDSTIDEKGPEVELVSSESESEVELVSADASTTDAQGGSTYG